MAPRKKAASRTDRDPRVTPQSIAAGSANLAKGRAAKEESRRKARAEGRPRAKERWAQLLDGTLTVQELDDDEIKNMRPRGADGGFTGRGRKMPSHLAQQFQQEAIKRAQDRFRNAAPEAVKALIEIGTDPDVREGDRIRALMYVVDRALGKTPETIRVEGADRWSSLLDAAGGVGDVDRDLADLADGTGSRVVADEESEA